jgi:hypothetical protein
MGRDDAVRGEPGQRRAPVLGEAQVHAAVGENVEREATPRPKAERPHPAGGPIIEGERLDSRDLLQPSYPPEQFPPRQRVARVVCEHAGPPSRVRARGC